MEQTIISQNQMVNEILHIGHGDLSIYTQKGLAAVIAEPELFGHLIAWNQNKGQIRDSKVALPILAFRGELDTELFENAAAHLCLLSARDLVRACRYHRELNEAIGTTYPFSGARWLKDAVKMYIRKRERKTGWWDQTAVQHRNSLKTLYAMYHIKPSGRAQTVLFDRHYPKGSVFEKIGELKNMPAQEAAGTILNYKIPFLIAVGAAGGIANKPDLILALIEQMSPAELINNSAMLKRFGVMANPVMKIAYEKGLEKKTKTPVSTLKAGTAAKAVGDEKLAKKLEQVQEKQIDKLDGIQGDWLILGDRSGSMERSIEVAQHVAAILARQVKGNVHLVFFNYAPTYFNVTGKSYEEICAMTKRTHAGGATSIGCGLDYIMGKNILVNGIAICSDGGENTGPYFYRVYEEYEKKMAISPTVYLFHVDGDPNYLDGFCKSHQIQLETFELGSKVDYYSLPQIALTMHTSRYTLVEQIMNTKLLTFDDVFK